MVKKSLWMGFALGLVFSLLTFSQAAEKLKFGSAIKMSPLYYLPMLAAEEKGIWKQYGLNVEWVPFNASSALYKAMVTGIVPYAFDTPAGSIRAASAGVPLVILSSLQNRELFVMFVRSESPIKKPEDLKGAKIGISSFGGSSEAYSRLVAKSAGVEKEVKLVALGGISPLLAAMRTGAVDVAPQPTHLFVKMVFAGQVRPLVRVEKYVPKDWVGQLTIGQRQTIERDPDMIGNAVKATIQTTRFLKENSPWAINTMVSFHGLTKEMAQEVWNEYDWSTDGKINLKAVENVIKFMLDWGLVPKDKAPKVEEVFTDRFIR